MIFCFVWNVALRSIFDQKGLQEEAFRAEGEGEPGPKPADIRPGHEVREHRMRQKAKISFVCSMQSG